MMIRSITMPKAPTITKAVGTTRAKGTWWLVASRAAYDPAMMNSPCARLMTRMRPKMTPRPSAAMASTEICVIVVRIWLTSWSMCMVRCLSLWTDGARRTRRDRVGRLAALRRELLLYIGLLHKVAYLRLIRWLDVPEGLDNVEAVAGVAAGDMHRVREMVRCALQSHRAFRRVECKATLQGLEHLVPVE